MNKLKTNIRIASYTLSVFIGLVGCKEVVFNESSMYQKHPKYFVGYYNNFPVFHVANKGELIFLNQDKIYTYCKYDTTLVPKLVKDSVVIFSKGAELVVLKLGEHHQYFKTNSSIINVGYSRGDSSIYFSNNYKQEIKKLNLKDGAISILPIKGSYLTTIEDYLYFYKYSDENGINPIVDLYKVEMKEESISTRIAENLSEELLVIASDGSSLLSDTYKEKFGTYIFCLDKDTYSKVDNNIPGDFPFAYYDKNKSQFIFYNIYTLEKKCVDIKCRKNMNNKL